MERSLLSRLDGRVRANAADQVELVFLRVLARSSNSFAYALSPDCRTVPVVLPIISFTKFRVCLSGQLLGSRLTGQVATSTYPFSAYPYSSSIIIRPQIRGFTLSRIPEAYTLYLQEGGLPMMRPTGVADKAIDRIPWVGDSMKPKSIRDWYRILRAHYRLSRIRSIRFALWLHAGV